MGRQGGISERASLLKVLALFWIHNIITGLSLFMVLAAWISIMTVLVKCMWSYNQNELLKVLGGN